MNYPLFSFKNVNNTKIYNGPPRIFTYRYSKLPFWQKAFKLAKDDYESLEKVLEDKQIYNDISNFSRYYYDSFIGHLKERTPLEQNLKEIQHLLFESLSKKYELEHFIILALIIVFHKEK